MTRLRMTALFAMFAMLATACIGPLGDDSGGPMMVTATFPRTANLFIGSEVRVLGLRVGEINDITPLGDTVEVEFALDPERQYPADVNVRLQPVSLLGERFAQFDPPYTGGPTLADGASIPISRTGIPAEVDEVLRSFENFLSSLDAGALANLIDVLADTLDGNGAGLNDLIDSGSTTFRVLADSSGDLNELVDELAALNETLATRDQRIGSTLVNTSTVLRNLQADRDLLIGALTELTRATGELRPLILEHDDPLVQDLDVLATTLSTVDRNLSRLGDAFFGGQRLFNATGRAVDYENARLPLDNEATFLTEFINDRVEDRLTGLCLRLGLADCDTVGDILDTIPDLCLPGLCSEGGSQSGTSFSEAIGITLSQLSEESQAAIAEEVGAGPALTPPAETPSSASSPAVPGTTPGGESSEQATSEPVPVPQIPSSRGTESEGTETEGTETEGTETEEPNILGLGDES